MEIGVDRFGAVISEPSAGIKLTAVEHIENLLEEIVLADQVGLDVFGIGEHHRGEFVDSAPTVILAAAATRTEKIRLTSAVTVLSATDPVRVFQEFATLDLISRGRAEIVASPCMPCVRDAQSQKWAKAIPERTPYAFSHQSIDHGFNSRK